MDSIFHRNAGWGWCGQLAEHVCHDLLSDSSEDIFFGVEICVESAPRNLCFFDDVRDAGVNEAVRFECPTRCNEKQRLRRRTPIRQRALIPANLLTIATSFIQTAQGLA
jgi:hypothetical protein